MGSPSYDGALSNQGTIPRAIGQLQWACAHGLGLGLVELGANVWPGPAGHSVRILRGSMWVGTYVHILALFLKGGVVFHISEADSATFTYVILLCIYVMTHFSMLYLF